MTICLLLVSCGQKPARISPAERKALNSTISSSHNIDTLSMMQKRMEKEGNMLGSIIAYRLMGKEMRDDSQFVTLLYGAEVTEEQAAAVEESVRTLLPEELELTVAYGGQPGYYFLISVE